MGSRRAARDIASESASDSWAWDETVDWPCQRTLTLQLPDGTYRTTEERKVWGGGFSEEGSGEQRRSVQSAAMRDDEADVFEIGRRVASLTLNGEREGNCVRRLPRRVKVDETSHRLFLRSSRCDLTAMGTSA